MSSSSSTTKARRSGADAFSMGCMMPVLEAFLRLARLLLESRPAKFSL
jgi:hypothetical protein